MPEPTLPQAVTRRLLLNFWGWRLVDGYWIPPAVWDRRAATHLSEEAVDTMPAAQWTRLMRRWWVSAAAAN
jgi:hypothetical protein